MSSEATSASKRALRRANSVDFQRTIQKHKMEMQQQRRLLAVFFLMAICGNIALVSSQITFSRDWSPAGKRSQDCNTLLRHMVPQMAYVTEVCNSHGIETTFQTRK